MNRFHLVAVAAALALAACGPEEERNPNNVIPGNNGVDNNGSNNGTGGSNNGTTAGTNNGTAGSNNGTGGGQCGEAGCDPDQRCVRDVCVDGALKVACEEPQDVGTLDVATSHSFSGSTAEYADSLLTACGGTAERSGPDYAFQFQVSETATATATLTTTAAIDFVIEVRGDECDGEDVGLLCSDSADVQFLVEAGRTYFVVVEPGSGIDRGDFDLALEFSAGPACTPVGGATCDAGEVTRCRANGEVVSSCADACSGDGCLGDTCEAPIVVSGSMTFSGDAQAYTNSVDFDDQPTCSTNGDGIASIGSEVVLSLPGLTAGQTVTVDGSTDDVDQAIFVQQTCGDSAECLAAVDLGDRLTFDVTADGDYFVVVDRLDVQDKPFNFTVDIQ